VVIYVKNITKTTEMNTEYLYEQLSPTKHVQLSQRELVFKENDRIIPENQLQLIT